MGATALRVAGAAAFLTAISTFLLWWLPQLVPAHIAPETLREHPAYMARLWINLGHVLLALYAYGAAASLLARRSATLAAIGFIAFCFWALLEALGVSVNIFAVNGTWRASMAVGGTDAAMASGHVDWFKAWWDAVFFLLLIAFLIGTTALGSAAVAGSGLERTVGWLMLAAAPLTLAIIASGYFGIATFEAFVDVVYPALQPASRGLLGLWLWQSAALQTRRGGSSKR